MKNILIVNLGNSDLQIREDKKDELKEIFKDDSDIIEILEKYGNLKNSGKYKLFTKKLFDEYPKGLECIEFPLVKPTLERLNTDLAGTRLDKIFFMTTDQNNDKDTIYVGRILEKIKKDQDSKNLNLKCSAGLAQIREGKTKELNFGKIEVRTIRENPADYDSMMKVYEDLMMDLDKLFYDDSKIDNLYLEITGGTPAMSMALLYNSTYQNNNRVIPYYVKMSTDKSQVAYKYKISESLKIDKIKKQIIFLIKNHQYKNAYVMVEDYKNKFSVNKEDLKIILNMIKAGLSRIEFNFVDAEKFITDVYEHSPESREKCENFIALLKSLKMANILYLINEVKNNALYKYKTGAYTDFLGRVFRTQEAIYEYMVLDNNIATKSGTKLYFNENYNLSTDKQDELNNAKIDGNKLKYIDIPLNIDSMQMLLKILLNKDSREYALVENISKLKSLKSQRNSSILAHGYKGISEEDIKKVIQEIYTSEEIIDYYVMLEKYLNSLVNEFYEIYKSDERFFDDRFYKEDSEFNIELIKLIEKL